MYEAISAYNEYRKSAKKTAYRTDLLAVHKGWLAFGVELDSFCERETSPIDANINSVGMASLFSSKLYGDRSTNIASCECDGADPAAPGTHYALGTCDDTDTGVTCTGAATTAGTWNTLDTYAPNGPGKSNFIGFGDVSACTNPVSLNGSRIQDTISDFANSGDCDLTTTEYEMGVGGHLAGEDYFSQHINRNGILSTESIEATGTVDTNCS